MALLKIQLLGEFRLEYDGALLQTVDTQRLQSLLTYLLVHRAAPQSRQRVAFQLWPDSSEAQARTNLRNLLHFLQKALPESERFLAVDGQNLQWRTDSPYHLDVDAFEKAVKQTDSIESLEGAVNLYRGELLPGCYEDWILPERQRLEREFNGALERLIALLEGRREYRRALTLAERLRAQDPLREDAYRKQMHLYGLIGDRAEAKRVYEECKAVLKQELGDDVEPSAETQQVYRQAVRNNSLPAQGTMVSAPAKPAKSALADVDYVDSSPVEHRRLEPPHGRPSAWLAQRRPARAARPYLKTAGLVVNYLLPVFLLVILVAGSQQSLVISLLLSIALYVGLYLLLNLRTGSEKARHELRQDVMAELDKGREQTAEIRRAASRVHKPEVAERIARICDVADQILEKLSTDRTTSLAAATRLESVLAEAAHILDEYVAIHKGKLAASPDKLRNTTAAIEQVLLSQIESFLLDLQVKLDKGSMIDLETEIQVMLERLKLEGLN